MRVTATEFAYRGPWEGCESGPYVLFILIYIVIVQYVPYVHSTYIVIGIRNFPGS